MWWRAWWAVWLCSLFIKTADSFLTIQKDVGMHVMHRIANAFEPARLVSSLNLEMHASGGVPLFASGTANSNAGDSQVDSTRDRLRKVNFAEILTFHQASFIYVGTADGLFMGHKRDYKSQQLQFVQMLPDENDRDDIYPHPRREFWNVDANTGDNIESAPHLTETTFHHRTRPWYKAASESSNKLPLWSNVYLFADNETLGISHVSSVWNGTQLWGVLAVDLPLHTIDDWLKESFGLSTLVFVLEESTGYLVASSNPHQIISSSGRNRIHATESVVPNIAIAAKHLESRESYGKTYARDLVDDLIIESTFFASEEGTVDWRIVVVQSASCPKGFSFSNETFQCIECPSGTYSTKAGSGSAFQCVKCGKGTFADVAGSISCKRCPPDTYTDTIGSTTLKHCTPCSVGKTTGDNGHLSTSENACKCKQNQFFTSENGTCLPCPKGANCSLGNGLTAKQVYARPGFWKPSENATKYVSCSSAYPSPNALQLARDRCCGSQTNCLKLATNPNTTFHPDLQCKTGYSGILCSVCAHDFVRLGDTCVSCPEGSKIWLSTIPVIIFSVLFGLFTFILVSSTKGFTEEPRREPFHDIYDDVRVFVSWVQIFATITLTFDRVPWGSAFISYNTMLGVPLTFDLQRMLSFSSCQLSLSFLESTMLTNVFAILLLVSAYIGQWLGMRLTCCSRSHDGGASKITSPEEKIMAQESTGYETILSTALFLYPLLLNRSFNVFRCVIFNDIEYDRPLLRRDVSVVCFEGEHIFHMVLASLVILVIGCGLPAHMLLELRRLRSHFHNENSPHFKYVSKKYGWALRQFEEEHWYFSVLEMIFKLLLTGVFCIFVPEHPLQIVIAMLLCIIYSMSLLRAAPFVVDSSDVLAISCCMCLSLTAFLGFLILADVRFGDEPAISVKTLDWMLVSVNLVPITIFGFNTSMHIKKGKCSRSNRGDSDTTQVVPVAWSN